jgi:hypothetical protein
MNPDEFLELAENLVDMGSEQGVTLRLLGSLAVIHHIQDRDKLLNLIDRVPTRDIDFMGYSEEQTKADRMFTKLGYEIDPSVAYSLEYGIQRLIYHHREQEIMAEIFLDQLRMSHTLDFRGRLELDHPTISLIDLLLSKLQIQEITEKDIKDIIVLLSEHDLGRDSRESVDLSHLLSVTSDDWGFYYTAKTNLDIVKLWLGKVDVIENSMSQDIETKLNEIKKSMEEAPKSLRWNLRSIIGTRMKWYERVGDVHNIHA